jgi:hypothetical protein
MNAGGPFAAVDRLVVNRQPPLGGCFGDFGAARRAV